MWNNGTPQASGSMIPDVQETDWAVLSTDQRSCGDPPLQGLEYHRSAVNSGMGALIAHQELERQVTIPVTTELESDSALSRLGALDYLSLVL